MLFRYELIAHCVLLLAASASYADIEVAGDDIKLTAGMMERRISMNGSRLVTESLRVAGHEILARPADEMSVTFTRAEPNRRPVGIKPGEAEAIRQKATTAAGTDALEVTKGSGVMQKVAWLRPTEVKSSDWHTIFDSATHAISRPRPGVTRLDIEVRSSSHPMLKGVAITLHYETYDGFPAVRKWIEVANGGSDWLKIEKLLIEGLSLSAEYLNRTAFTPEERGAGSSIIGLANKDASRGVIAMSEVPSALRAIHPQGAMGYADEHFEWVLGPNEAFVSEAVSYFGFSGETHKTVSGVSRAVDRAIEGPFQDYLARHVGIAADVSTLPVPLWCSWTNFGPQINDELIRQQADLAAKAGFACILLDAGWAVSGGSWDAGGTDPNAARFPDFRGTCEYVRSKGLGLGVWVSCFRDPNSRDLKDVPNGRSLPEVKRTGAIGMSFAGPWRDYYAKDIARLNTEFGAVYVKQDLTNIKFGDIAEGHDSRTLKESLLRGLRGFFETQDTIRKLAPGMCNEITHEIYWGTPGVPADVAALKHAATYHIPPNDYSGCGHGKQRPNPGWTYDPLKLRKELLGGCLNARQGLYAHRGLPLQRIEYYAAVTVNFKGSLTPQVQDRQVCSWLMGAPSVFAGDLASLTPENIAHYRKRFDLLRRLQKAYGIYGRFQFSGVPEPTDTDWHWWGKLDDAGCGAVVVLRGSAGKDERQVNLPWVKSGGKYRVTACFEDRTLGAFTGRQLQEGIRLTLPVYGQEILELTAE